MLVNSNSSSLHQYFNVLNDTKLFNHGSHIMNRFCIQGKTIPPPPPPTQTHTHANMCMCVQVYACVCVCMHVYACVCVCMRVCIYMHK